MGRLLPCETGRMRTPVHGGRVPISRRCPRSLRLLVPSAVLVLVLASCGADATPEGERPMFTSASALPAEPSAAPTPASQAASSQPGAPTPEAGAATQPAPAQPAPLRRPAPQAGA